MQQPFEEEFSDQGDGMSDLLAEGEEGFEDGFEGEGFEAEDFEGEGFEAEGFDGEGFESDGFEAEGFEGEGFEGDEAPQTLEGFEGDGFEGEGFESDETPQALEDAFAEAMDAHDEDEFLRRLGGAIRRVARVAGPTLRRIGRRALPIGMRLLRQAAPQLGGIAGQEIGRTVAGLLQADAMDAYADAAADYATEEDMEAFTAVLGGLAARSVVRRTIPPARRAQQSRQVRQLGRAIGRLTSRLARQLVNRYGPRALTAVPRIVNQVTRMVREQGASPQAVPRMLRRTGNRVASSPPAVRRLARPNPAARRLRAQAGVGRPARRPAGRPTAGRTPRTVTLRAPVRLIVRR
ncbi:hypothetical protein MYSTI_07196 [Myxococcus stipitatus DSM 14675]|uniref:Uncharacterized protein n=1 Tax=Myxococcus stipitatus (strain DSM 14675 / JCM 12634 / Mx s8) TaxID=1278073 RepID=L7UKD1_MYXSD|nr:hypothetical protein [Myxococcus stipitatus]AGC48468.1 hypothetical protein MYSTI_07196 [Myxococcus stipitatus DSM 14675]